MLLLTVILAAASLTASGVLFWHQRWITYLAAAGVLLEGQWLLLTLLNRTLLASANPAAVYTAGSIVLLGVWLLQIHLWRRPAFAWRRETAAAVVTIIVLAAAWSVVGVNGFREGAWITHGFYNGDVVTLMALVQRSLVEDGLVRSNPFAGGGPLEYPTLVHAGLADAFQLSGLNSSWPAFLPLLTLVTAGMTVPLLFLLWDVVHPEPHDTWRLWFGVEKRTILHIAQGGIALYVLALAWDGYVYPQSHFFITGIYVLLAALLARAAAAPGPREALWVLPAGVCTLLLLLANAVTGAAAVAVFSTFCLWRAADRIRAVPARALYLAAAALVAWLFLVFLPGEPAFGGLQFPYTAAASLMLLAPAWFALAVCAWLSRPRDSFLVAAAVGLTLMSFFTFFFSSREIVAENASRFIYHALIIGMVLCLGPAVRLFYWLRQKLVYETQPWLPRLAAGASVACALFILALPALASVASAHDHLQRQDRQVVTASQLGAATWLSHQTPADAVILASPQPPWFVPMFSGRALLRTDYWLSPRDEMLDSVEQAFAGNRALQDRVRQEADYLLLTDDEQRAWDTDDLETVFRGEGLAVFRLRS